MRKYALILILLAAFLPISAFTAEDDWKSIRYHTPEAVSITPEASPVTFEGAVISILTAVPGATPEIPVPSTTSKPAGKGKTVAPRSNVREIRIIARQFEFVPNNIAVPKGMKVRLLLTSEDVTHGFAIDKLNIDAKIEKGKITVVEFTPVKSGTYEFYCNIECGEGHPGMRGKLTVL